MLLNDIYILALVFNSQLTIGDNMKDTIEGKGCPFEMDERFGIGLQKYGRPRCYLLFHLHVMKMRGRGS